MKISKYYDVVREEGGSRQIQPDVTGMALLGIPLLNKGTAFTVEERRKLGLVGLLPPHVSTLEEQKHVHYEMYCLKHNELEKHIFLRSLQDRNEVLFYALVADHVAEMLPILYTPTVGEAVKQFSYIYRFPRGYSFSLDEIGTATEGLANFQLDDVRLAVATDSSAILGIGDQGYGGMAISIGKLTIYTVAGGVGPDKVLPIELDVGTGRTDLLADPMYLGARKPRISGEEYFKFMDEFVDAFKTRYPSAIMQWEDFSKDTAFAVLDRYREVLPSFNDDIQGTGAVALAGSLSACRIKGERLTDQNFLICGAGAGGAGVAAAIIAGLIHEGSSEEEARSKVFVLDSKGLLTSDRKLDDYKVQFATPAERIADWKCAGPVPNMLEIIRNANITALLGLSGQGGSFTEEVVAEMFENSEHPIIFPLSNPTSATEALPENIIKWTDGQALIATGSPFADVEFGGKVYPVGQGNNAFVFPGIGFGAVLSKAQRVSDEMVLEAAYALFEYTSEYYPLRIYPPIDHLRDVCQRVAARVISKAVEQGHARDQRVMGKSHEEVEAYVRERFWEPHYLPFSVPFQS